MPELKTVAKRLGFGPLSDATGRRSVADLLSPSPKRRSGLYLLGFSNGEAYIGLSKDIGIRFARHSQVYGDITAFAFRALPLKGLDVQETKTIERAEKLGCRLRNIRDTSDPQVDSELDAIINRDDQDRFIRYGSATGMALTVPKLPDLRRKYMHRFGQFMAAPLGIDAVSALGVYLPLAIPAPASTQAAFWGTSVLPSGRILTRVNVHWQEVLTIWAHDDQLRFSAHLARSPLEAAYGRGLKRLRGALEGYDVDEHRYKPGGVDQVCLRGSGLSEVRRLLEQPAVAEAVRAFNLRLMRKGGCMWGRNHCPQVAELALRLSSRREG